MSELKILIFLHILSATIWVGYYLLLAFKTLPMALKNNDFGVMQSFEKPFHNLTMIALLVQVLVGFRMAMLLLPMKQWFNFSDPISSGITLKFILLGLLIVLIGLNKSVFYKRRNLKAAAIINYLITVISVLFIYTGISIRFGGF
jgi:hypothetical protein